ncbi:MAG: winged helix-turn-helix domain-containing protein [Clostridia bacterium]|nr:winged helix-turn-helix domain-containing protein [Clostridia bacterium]
MPQQISIQILGNFTITVDGQKTEALSSRSRKGVTLLIYLILRRGKCATVQQMIHDLWGASPGVRPENALKTRICRLRALLNSVAPRLGRCIFSEPGGYSYLALPGVEVDALELLDIIDLLSGDPDLPEDTYMAYYQRAMELYNGELFTTGELVGDVEQSSWLRRGFLDIAAGYARLLESRNDYAALAEVCRKALDQEPLAEVFRAALIRALLAMNRPEDARREYAQAVRMSFQMLNGAPGEELQALGKKLRAK